MTRVRKAQRTVEEVKTQKKNWQSNKRKDREYLDALLQRDKQSLNACKEYRLF